MRCIYWSKQKKPYVETEIEVTEAAARTTAPRAATFYQRQPKRTSEWSTPKLGLGSPPFLSPLLCSLSPLKREIAFKSNVNNKRKRRKEKNKKRNIRARRKRHRRQACAQIHCLTLTSAPEVATSRSCLIRIRHGAILGRAVGAPPGKRDISYYRARTEFACMHSRPNTLHFTRREF